MPEPQTPEGILPLELDGVVFEAGGRTLIHDFNARFEAGPRAIVLGPNGAGKSLLLRLCHGLLRPSRGRIAWHGQLDGHGQPDGHGQSERQTRQRQAMVFQRPVLLRRSALANVAYPLVLRGMPRGEARARAAEALARAGLDGLAARPARVLSGGEQQRLALARAWVTEPEILFLDEPTASLDPAATRAVETMVLQIHQAGTKIVMTTHDLGQARRLAEEVLFLHHGRLIERAPAEAFFAAPRTPEAAAFIRGDLVI
ncbi:MAG: ATP-binding cassette domain-containing protein [Alphaproteobacteria bacterium]